MKKFLMIILPYWKSRGLSHLREVFYAARRLAGRPLNIREFLTISLHDIGVGRNGFDRNHHSEGSIDAIEHDDALAPIRPFVDDEMKNAILHHMRDSYRKTGILSDLHQLLIEADEGIPKWGTERIEKPVKYWLDGRGMSIDSPIEKVVDHIISVLRNKITSFHGDQLPFTERYKSVFSHEIEMADKWVKSVTYSDVIQVINQLRKE